MFYLSKSKVRSSVLVILQVRPEAKKKTQMFEVHSSTLYKYECEKVSFHYLIIRYHIPKESSHKTNNVYVFHPKAMYRLCGYYVNDLGAYN